MSDQRVKFVLDEPDIPTHWVNLMADLPGEAPPPLHPSTKQPAGPDDLSPIFPMALILQEVSTAPEIEIPNRVREVYRLWRPTPLYRARRLERELDTPAHIYYKYEGGSPPGSHKPNTAVAQAYENAQAGIKKLTTETGAGQWGSALAFACRLFGLECEVWMVGSSYDQKPYRRSMMETWGATVHRSPSEVTESGRSQAGHPTGSLGIAISEAVEVAAQNADTNYSLGSVLNHVLLHQTVIGQEAIAQLGLAGEEPDVVVACVGGGSNFGGLAFPFLRRVMGRRQDQVRGRRAGRLFDPDPRRLCVRLRRHGRAHPAHADVHARPRLRAAAGARRRPALPRRLAARMRAGQAGPDRAARLQAERDVRRGRALRPDRGDHPCARARPRHPGRDRGGGGGARGRRIPRDPVRPVRPRQLRPERLRRLPGRQPRGSGVFAGRPRRGARGAAGGSGAGLSR